jgi:hypothetical protein
VFFVFDLPLTQEGCQVEIVLLRPPRGPQQSGLNNGLSPGQLIPLLAPMLQRLDSQTWETSNLNQHF